MKNLKWRQQRSMDRHDCKTGCCKTALGICHAKYLCDCHLPEVRRHVPAT